MFISINLNWKTYNFRKRKKKPKPVEIKRNPQFQIPCQYQGKKGRLKRYLAWSPENKIVSEKVGSNSNNLQQQFIFKKTIFFVFNFIQSISTCSLFSHRIKFKKSNSRLRIFGKISKVQDNSQSFNDF